MLYLYANGESRRVDTATSLLCGQGDLYRVPIYDEARSETNSNMLHHMTEMLKYGWLAPIMPPRLVFSGDSIQHSFGSALL